MLRTLRRLAMPVVALALAACGSDDAPTANTLPEDVTYAPALNVDLSAMTRTASGLYYRDLAPGEGTPAAPGNTVAMHYTGWLPDGREFDSSRDRGPYSFPIGAGRVIRGWDEGVVGMRVGGRRQLVIPSALGYGSRANGPIPANSVLVFMVERVERS